MENNCPAYRVVMDVDCTSPPITVNTDDDPYISVKHRVYSTASFRKDYKQPDPAPLTTSEKCREHLRNFCSCSGGRAKKACEKLFPFVRIYRKYKWKIDLPSDVIAGITVGIMQLPQGMAYSMLADLPPVVGLYMSFFPVLIYFFFGSSRHISMGTVAVVSLMTGSVVARLGPSSSVAGSNSPTSPGNAFNSTWSNFSDPNITTSGDPYVLTQNSIDAQKIALAASMTFLVGVIQVLFGFCRLGFVTTYMSDPLVSGFTTGAAVHVFTSQVKYIFGLKIPRFGNLFQIVFTYKAIFENIAKTNIPTLITSAICIVVIYLVKVQINYRFKDRLKIPLPVELLVVVVGTVASHFAKFEETYGMKVVGTIPAGLPVPTPPSFDLAGEYISDAIIIAVVAFAQSVSLAALMAKKHMYAIDSNQEFVAYGMGNIFGSFFSCYPFAASVSRSSVQDSAGGKSQITSLFSATLVLVVIIVIGPLFESLPNCVLSAIIVVALRSMFLQFFELKKLWKISGFDFNSLCLFKLVYMSGVIMTFRQWRQMIWIVTFLCVVILYVDLGLWIGLIFSFFTVVLRTQRTKAISLKKVSSVDFYADEKKYIKTKGYPGVCIVGFNSPLYYANGDIFVKQLFNLSGLKPERARKQIKRLGSIQEFRRSLKNGTISTKSTKAKKSKQSCKFPMVGLTSSLASSMAPSGDDVTPRNSNGDVRSTDLDKDSNANDSGFIHHIIVDFSSVSFIDTVGAKVLNQVIEEYKTIAVTVFVANVKDNVWDVLNATGFVEKFEKNVYLTMQDAVIAAISEGENNFPEKDEDNNYNYHDDDQPIILDDDNDYGPEDRLLPV